MPPADLLAPSLRMGPAAFKPPQGTPVPTEADDRLGYLGSVGTGPAAAAAEAAPAAASGTVVSASGNPLIDGMLSGLAWNGTALGYSFPTATSSYNSTTYTLYGSGELTSAFAAVSPQMAAVVRAVLEGTPSGTGTAVMTYGSYESFTNLNFTEGTTTSAIAAAELRYARSGAPNPTAWGYYPDSTEIGGDVWFGTVTAFNTPLPGSWSYVTAIHETGHALGLKHPHENGVNGTGALPSANDSLEFTVMSYRSYVGAPTSGGYTNETYGYPTTPMMLDIQALQYLYGADYTTNSGNTTYSWSPTTGEMFVDGVGQGAPGANRIFLTIWDGGGRDTYDMSNYTNGVSIDLTPGKWSVTSPQQLAMLDSFSATPVYARGNVFNALLYNNDTRSLIEDAKGGSGNDTILGNQAENGLYGNNGNDTLTGGLGNDSIDGGQGTDSAVFSGNRAGYTISRSGGALIVSGADGTDTISNVETLVFADGSYAASGLGTTSVSVSALSAAKAEGASGNTSYTFTVTRTGDTGGAQTVDWSVAGTGGAPASASDFAGGAFPSGSVSFAAGETSKTVTITVAGDKLIESTEQFTVTLTNPSTGAAIGTASATGAIWNDDFIQHLPIDSSAGDDLVWQSNGQFLVSSGAAGLGQIRVAGTPGAGYEFKGTGQVGGDAGTDVIWAKAGGGVILGIGAGSPLNFTLVPVSRPGSTWTYWTQADLNGDGRVELLWKQGEALAVTQLNSDGSKIGDTWLGMPGSGWAAVAAVDLNGDGRTDILWQNNSMGGALASGLVNASGNGFTSINWLSLPGAGWTYAGVGDFNGDGRTDTVWTEANGHMAVMYTSADGTTTTGAYWFSKPGTGWELVGVGDFNGDGRADTLWQNPSLGGAVATFITRSTMSAAGVNADGYWWGLPGAGWHYAGIADSNGDGRDDVLFEDAGGATAALLANSTGGTSGAVFLGIPGADWHLVG